MGNETGSGSTQPSIKCVQEMVEEPTQPPVQWVRGLAVGPTQPHMQCVP
jgi:hypothetical protein